MMLGVIVIIYGCFEIILLLGLYLFLLLFVLLMGFMILFVGVFG